ncbi:MAG TPA: molybdenum cofactor biosynthesis protein MoaE [Longimicrobiales bacterium]|nr:molybdenum cofactor biosynthesis protein MoaE [Longimicrobiales bacterium]
MRAWITTDPIAAQDVLDGVGTATDGATVVFLGTVREENDGRPVSGLRYDAYVAMAEDVLLRIAGEAGRRAGTDRVAVVHRIGELAVGDASVAIAVSSPHRAEAFDAARFVIEAIKQRLPVWKQEYYVEGAPRWLDGSTPAVGP